MVDHTYTAFLEAIGPALRAIRERKGQTRRDVSDRLGWKSETSLVKIEAGSANPTWETLLRVVLRGLGASLADLVHELYRQADIPWPHSDEGGVPSGALDLVLEALTASQRSAESQALGMRQAADAIKALRDR